MRLDKYVSKVLGITRNEARQNIKSGAIKIEFKNNIRNDDSINEITDVVYYNGQKLEYIKYIYIMLNKPQGYLSATFDKSSPTVVDLVKEYQKYNLAMVGRLDKDTEGLFLLTNDGKFAHNLTSPKKDLFKKYYVEINEVWNKEDIMLFEKGLEIYDGNKKLFKTKPAKLEILADSKAYISISEGKYHQIKKMCLKIGKEVKYLKRIAIGNLYLDENLALGEYRLLTIEEIEKVKNVK
ncbi:MAG: 16S rRNA pseudouridine(516) synthase [Bacilli bacterium]|nr:16S rRNA pseudouridine(516) synthase [Bacilli bacterium]